MSHHLWRYFLEDDVENFKKFLANARTKQNASKPVTMSRGGPTSGSPGAGRVLSTSPVQTRKSSGTPVKSKATQNVLSKADINVKDHGGLTLLHCVASSRGENAWEFAQALLDQPLVDILVPDTESSWTALHRALYFGNVTIARSILNRDTSEVRGQNALAAGTPYKIKDREGNSPFDLFNASIAPRSLAIDKEELASAEEDEEQENGSADDDGGPCKLPVGRSMHAGDDLFVFGSNKNLNLGVGDEDDRQFPERVVLKRPAHLLQRLRLEHLSRSLSRRGRFEGNDEMSGSIDLGGENPALVQFKPIRIRDIQLSKLHTAILTDDPEANLYTCGFGPGGRLGTGDEGTRFNFTCIYGGGLQGQKVQDVGLGQDHSLAITSSGEVFSWGNNRFGQLGYAVSSGKDEDPIQLLPRQIFGPLKRERALGCAASRIHSVVYTASNLYTFGKNEGQLGLVDSDARSLEMQTTPRAVAASLFQHAITQVTAIDKATACLLESTDVWVFANYGYTRVKFPVDDFSNYFLRNTYSTVQFGSDGPNYIVRLGSGGDTISARTGKGQVFTLTVSQSIEPAGKASTTNPAKIKNALSEPKKVWSPRKESMACVDVDVGQDGSIIICTKSGSVWRRTKRAKAKDAKSSGATGGKPKDYKFSRVPGLTCMGAVRSNAFGSFAAIRYDWDVMQTQIHAPVMTIWQDCFALFPFKDLAPPQEPGHLEVDLYGSLDVDAANIRRAVLKDKDLESTLKSSLCGVADEDFDIELGSTVTDIRIPCHTFLLSGRSGVLRKGLATLHEDRRFDVADVLSVDYDDGGRPSVLFKGIDILTLFNLVLYLYTDNIVDVWHYTRFSPDMTMRYKQVRIELMKVASALGLKELERAARLQIEPKRMLSRDMERAYIAPGFFEQADIEIELKGASYHTHRALMVQRCPFFEGMFAGHSGGGWVRSRYDDIDADAEDLLKVDLTHVEPRIFDLVLRHLYADTGPEMFDEVVASDLDEFLDTIMEVMAVANELMLDRLSQVCQLVLGRFVNTRNVCQLLNAVAPCSVTIFKTAALEYVCLNLEIMLENHLLDELDDELMIELDEVVRLNQDANFGYTHRGSFAEVILLERHPDLAERLEYARRRKVDSMALRARRLQREEDERTRGEMKSPKLAPRSPQLAGKASIHDLLFDMDEDGSRSPFSRPLAESANIDYGQDSVHSPLGSPLHDSPWLDGRTKPSAGTLPSPALGSLTGTGTPERARARLMEGPQTAMPTRSATAPWGSTPLKSARLDMRQIMEQADDKRHSNISAGLAAQADGQKQAIGSFKVSQKERKRQMLEQQKRESELARQQQQLRKEAAADSKIRPSAWQTVSSGSKVSLKEVFDKPPTATKTAPPPTKSGPGAGLTLRQTVPGNVSKTADVKGKASAREKPVPQRSVSSPVVSRPAPQPFGSSTKITTQARAPSPKLRQAAHGQTPPFGSPSPGAPRSMRHASSPSEPSLQLSMADILSQQQMEKDVIKEATAKRSLQEIQQEQEFMEWWEAEEKATKARIDAETRATTASASRGGKGGRGRGRGRQKSGRGDGKGADKQESGEKTAERPTRGGRRRGPPRQQA